MKQVVQAASGGPVRVVDVPRPIVGPTEVLVKTVASVVSPGTERAVTKLAQSSLLAKARARPDLVRQVLKKARDEGLASTTRAVRSRLDDEVPLGYSACGIAVEVGEAVSGIVPGQLVATGGAGRANHAEYQSVPGLLCAPVPEGVTPADAAFATVASVALHGLRRADLGPGAKLVVIGLGLMGQLAVRLARSAGCDVAGIDLGDLQVELAASSGALGLRESGADTTEAVLDWSRGRGADAVLLTAATRSSSVIARTPELCCDGATVVVVGDVGLEIDRRPFYERELTIRFARSYGPGRYERSYEEWGVDFPPGQVRWTEGRNLEAILDLMATGRLQVSDLVTRRFDIADAAAAYELVGEGGGSIIGLAFDYPGRDLGDQPVLPPPRSRKAAGPRPPGLGLIGAGAFASTVLVPALKKSGFQRLVAVTSASGLSAMRLAERAGFERAVSGADAVIDDPEVDTVVIATPHATHASLVARALRAGKHVFCEKPLALTLEELDDVEAAWRDHGGVLFVGFNRRWSDPVRVVREQLGSRPGPLVITYRVSAGNLPASHWYHDRVQGGRLLGEVCHFVDTCAAIVGSPAVEVQVLGGGCAERLLTDDLAVSLRYPDGSLASVTYASNGHPQTEKESIEILGRGHTAKISNFETVTVDGQKRYSGNIDKGHLQLCAAFWRAVVGVEEDQEPADAFASTRSTLLAASRLTGWAQSTAPGGDPKADPYDGARSPGETRRQS